MYQVNIQPAQLYLPPVHTIIILGYATSFYLPQAYSHRDCNTAQIRLRVGGHGQQTIWLRWPFRRTKRMVEKLYSNREHSITIVMPGSLFRAVPVMHN
jgi:hypothetical protein